MSDNPVRTDTFASSKYLAMSVRTGKQCGCTEYGWVRSMPPASSKATTSDNMNTWRPPRFDPRSRCATSSGDMSVTINGGVIISGSTSLSAISMFARPNQWTCGRFAMTPRKSTTRLLELLLGDNGSAGLDGAGELVWPRMSRCVGTWYEPFSQAVRVLFSASRKRLFKPPAFALCMTSLRASRNSPGDQRPQGLLLSLRHFAYCGPTPDGEPFGLGPAESNSPSVCSGCGAKADSGAGRGDRGPPCGSPEASKAVSGLEDVASDADHPPALRGGERRRRLPCLLESGGLSARAAAAVAAVALRDDGEDVAGTSGPGSGGEVVGRS
mmetsp:Transcript_65744/g.189554  ORF Transcript_65744/g.189554 Transcript_65744/m.189554 type:complete len:326 (+) Transcript_65744:2236-3213(+)